MTPTQRQKLTQATEILREHFTAGLIVIQAIEENNQEHEVAWTTNVATTMGLCTVAEMVLKDKITPRR